MAIGWYSGEGLGRHVSGFVGITGLEELEARSEMRPTVKMHEDWERRNEGPCVTPIPSLKKNGAQFSCSVMSGSLRPHGLQHARPPCPSPTLGVYSNSCPSSQWCHPTNSSSVVPFSSRLQYFPASRSFPISQFFASGGQSTGISALTSFLPMNIQDWSPLGWTGWISLQSKGLSRVFSNTTVQKHRFFSAQLSL